MLELARGRGDDHSAPRGGTRDIREWRNVDPYVLIAELPVGVAAASVHDRAVDERPGRQKLAAQREGASDDPRMAVDHLHGELPAAERRIERAGSGQQRRRRDTEARDVHGAPAQRAIERAVQAPADERFDTHPEDDDREHDRERRGDDDACTQRPGIHRPSTKPTPRTVSISAGSPSFRRR